MVTKVDAAGIATASGIPVVLTAAAHAAEVLAGEPVGTCFHPIGGRRASRLLWLAHATTPRGRLRPRRRRGARGRRAADVAAAGRDHRGRRATSSPVTRSTCSTKTATRWPAGWSTLTRQELPGLLGRSTRELARELGPAYEREVVHRDDLVLLRRNLRAWARHGNRLSGDEPGGRVSAPSDPVAARLTGGPRQLWHVVAHRARAQPATPRTYGEGSSASAPSDPFLLSCRYAEDRAEVRYWEEARDVDDAAALALRLWGEHRTSAGLPPWSVAGVEVVAPRRLPAPRPPPTPPSALATSGGIRPF